MKFRSFFSRPSVWATIFQLLGSMCISFGFEIAEDPMIRSKGYPALTVIASWPGLVRIGWILIFVGFLMRLAIEWQTE